MGSAPSQVFVHNQDHETAASAVRNLNNVEVGGRQLRIDFADDKDAPEESKPRKVDSNQNSAEVITPIVQQMDPQQLAEVLSYLKLMTQSNPEQAAMLLQQNPQIAFAVLQALVQMNLVDAYSMQRILQAQGKII
jgi:cleavage stimulation factor subunit 2